MQMSSRAPLLVAFCLLSHLAEAATPAKSKVTLLAGKNPKVSPPVTGSDKKFFGPPFPANYPDDKRPVVEKSIMDKLKGPDQPYPALQSASSYDADYVKDENADHGAWKAQFEYDTLRSKLRKEGLDARGAGDRADEAGRRADDAQGNADRAGKDVDSAQKDLDDARAAEEGSKHDPDDWAGPPSHEKLDKLKAAVADAEKDYEKEKKEFEECKKQLEESKKILDDLKAKHVEMEKQLAAETKLWAETKTVRLNAKKSREDAAHRSWMSAAERLKAAQEEKTEVDTILVGKKAQHEKALQNLAKEKADVERAKKELEKATLTLQKIRGYTPPAKSSATVASLLLPFAFVAGYAL